MLHMLRIVGCTATLIAAASAVAQPSSTVETIDVVGTTPLGAGVDADKIAANVQTATAADLRESAALELTDFMRRNLGGVFVNEVQSNPLQPDVQYRGFVGSPLLGLPQGLAVYQDGVRVNEPFGDTVNWALIPESAIDTVYLMPGANPVFGLNALGGALAIDTKDGFRNDGREAELVTGSFGRLSFQAEAGGALGEDLAYFVTGAHLQEDGWRDFSLTDADQIFATLASRGERSRVDVSLTYAETDLVGNGAAPVDLLEQDRTAIFTHPDRTENRLAMLNVRGEQTVSDSLTLLGNLYTRHSDTRTLNGDDSDFAPCLLAPALLCQQDDGSEEILVDADGAVIVADGALMGATINRTNTEQDSFGFSLQGVFAGRVRGVDHELTIGLATDQSDVAFAASTELGTLDGTRLAVGGGVLLGDAFVGLDASTRNMGLYVVEMLSPNDTTTLTLAGRFNRTDITLVDLLGDELNGAHRFERFNPAIGITKALSDALTFYASYSEASRAPSPVELTCADEDDPCRLPNAFVADPPLDQVVARTLEGGLRGTFARGRWHAGVFRATNEDDILFISAGALTNEGYFDNVGETRRSGVELNADGELGEKLAWSVDYTALSATFRESFVVTSPNNPAAVDGEIMVAPGDRLPLIPERLLKAGLRFAATPELSLRAEIIAASGQHYRGDEGNALEEVDGYALLNLRAEYRLGEHASLFVAIDNVLDEEYATFGVLGDPEGVLGTDFEDPRFLGPGAPRAAWAGVRVQF